MLTRDISSGVILLNEKTNLRNDGKYPYKLASLMTKDEIKKELNINGFDLPPPSRKHSDFKRQLVIPRGINDKDIKQLNWSNAYFYRSEPDPNNPASINLSISPIVMTNYIKIAKERMTLKEDHRGSSQFPGNISQLLPAKSISHLNKRNLSQEKVAESGANHGLEPIMIIDKRKNHYGIEWY